MNRCLDIVAKVLSVVFYPLFIPTYGLILFCWAHAQHIAPQNSVWMGVAIAGTLILTCFLPISSIWIMMKRGEVKDLQIEDRQQRTMPYFYSFLGFVFWCYLLASILHAPLLLSFIAIGGTIAISLVMLINRFWKISAHLTGIGGLVGGIMTYCLGIGAIPTWSTIILWMLLSLVMMFARLRLDAHTPAQVCAGWLTGIACTFLPYCIYSYVA